MIAAVRMLHITRKNGDIAVPVTIEVSVEDDRCWRCEFEIGWPRRLQRGHALGFDAMQALHLAMQTIATYLYASSYHRAGRLRFDRPGDGYGFPLPFASRDQAIGTDKTL